MIVVIVELWPKGHSERRREVARAHIVNDGSGTATRGNYHITLFDKRGAKWKTGKLLGFLRKRWLAMDLVLFALTAVLGDRHVKKEDPPEDELEPCDDEDFHSNT